MFLPALLAAIAPRLTEIEAARSLSKESLAKFLGRALDEAIAKPADASEPPPAASEFDALFG